ncbi:MAG: hypothetical protein AB7G17_00565 [Phycisphaerales bacterium]
MIGKSGRSPLLAGAAVALLAGAAQGQVVSGNATTGQAATLPPCNGDTNADRIVNFLDLNIVLGDFGRGGPGSLGDVNGDGVVNFLDLNIVLSNFTRECHAALIAPLSTLVVKPGQSASMPFSFVNPSSVLNTRYEFAFGKQSGSPTLGFSPSAGMAILSPNTLYSSATSVSVPNTGNATDDATIALTITSRPGAGGAPTAVQVVNAKAVVIPTGETTASNGWGAGGSTTVHRWQMTLTPGTTNFQGRSVTEQDAGGGGPDTCWFNGSTYARWTAITGGTWVVGANNVWGDDFVGWFSAAVTYYRAQGRAPCQTTFPQDMHINGEGSPRYRTNTLSCGFTAAGVWSTRDGQTRNKNWP